MNPVRRGRSPMRLLASGVAIAAAVLVPTGCSGPTPSSTSDGSSTTGGSPTTAGSGAPASTAAVTPTNPASPTVGTTAPSGPEGEGSGTETHTADPSAVTVPERGEGTTRVVDVPGQDTPAKDGPGRVVRYTVEVEKGLEDVAVGFPAAVRADLTHARGWQTKDRVRFVNVSPTARKDGARTDIRILFASPALVDRECAPLRTNGRLSCHSDGKVMINAWRWIHGSRTYEGDLASYRIYLVNHEVGHAIGHGHVPCGGSGEKAPVMLQQTLRLDGCRPNPYPVR